MHNWKATNQYMQNCRDTRQVDSSNGMQIVGGHFKGFEVEGDKEYVLKIKKDLCGERQAGRVWKQHLISRLKKVGFVAVKLMNASSTKVDTITSTDHWTASLRR